MSKIYEMLEKVNTGVLYERAVERSLVALLQEFAVDGEPLNGAVIYTSVRGVPLVWDGINLDPEVNDVIDEARAKESYIVVIASEYQEQQGDEMCKLRVVISKKIYDGDTTGERYEQWCAAVRGIMSQAALVNGVLDIANTLQGEFVFTGWERDETPVSSQYVKQQWIYEETYNVYGVLSGESA